MMLGSGDSWWSMVVKRLVMDSAGSGDGFDDCGGDGWCMMGMGGDMSGWWW